MASAFAGRTLALALIIAWGMANAKTFLRNATSISGTTFADFARSPFVDTLLLVVEVHFAMVTAVVAFPSTVPLKATVLRTLGRLGRALRLRYFFAASIALLVALVAEEHRTAGLSTRFRLLMGLTLMQCTVLVLLRLNETVGADQIIALDAQVIKQEMMSWEPPPADSMPQSPLNHIFRPKFLGVEQVPTATRKVLFVMNHQMGGLEIPLFCEYCHLAHNLFPRALADHMHFYVPGWAQLLRAAGAIDGGLPRAHTGVRAEGVSSCRSDAAQVRERTAPSSCGSGSRSSSSRAEATRY